MSIRDRMKKLAAGTDEMHRERRRSVHDITDATPIETLTARDRARIAGEVSGIRIVPRANAPALEVTLDDGTGSVVAVFFGRTRIGGIVAGRKMIAEGLLVPEGGRLVLYNPEISLLP